MTVTHVTHRRDADDRNDTWVGGNADHGAGNGRASGSATSRTGATRVRGGLDGGRRRTVTYAEAGVSIHAGERAVELLKSKVQRTHRPEVLGDIGGVAGRFRLVVGENPRTRPRPSTR